MLRVNMDSQWAKSSKKQSEEVHFVNSALKIQGMCQKYTPTDCFFGDFAYFRRFCLLFPFSDS